MVKPSLVTPSASLSPKCRRTAPDTGHFNATASIADDLGALRSGGETFSINWRKSLASFDSVFQMAGDFGFLFLGALQETLTRGDKLIEIALLLL